MTHQNKYFSTLCVFAFSLHFVASGTASACTGSVNVALASNGAVATASSAYDPVVCGSGAVAANDGDRTGRARCNNRVWNDAAPANTFPDWLQIDFDGSKTITEIDVVTVQDHLEWPVEPTESMTFSQYGLTAYQVQYWNNSAWVTIPGGSVTGNNKIWRKFTFAAITTTKIRVWATASPDGYSRIVELEAWTGPSPEPRYDLALGATATASTSYPGWGPSAVVNGDRKSLNAYSNGAWSSSAANNFPEWVEVNFGSNKTINEIHVFALQDNWANSVEPTPAMTFTLYGLSGYDMQFWTGSSWVTVPGGNVTGNNKIWRTFTFSPISTSKIRVLTNAAPDGVSRITEIEAYAPPASCTTIARLDPLNATGGGGENPLSQNFNWAVPLVDLPGRAGLDLNLSLSYNSLVWTRSGNNISFNDDNGFPGPGFRLGFPVIQQLHYNGETGKHGFLLIGPDGSRTELRQVGTSLFFEATDSSHLLLDATDLTMRTADGTQLSYVLMGNQLNCTKIKDRNGNYISINYNLLNQIDTVVDTLNRTVKFNYDPNGSLLSITQIWKQGTANETTHTYASFEYTDVTFQTSFPNLTVAGASNDTTRKMLSKVTLDDNSPTPSNNSRFEFAYTSWGQVWKISNFAGDNHLMNYRSYNLSGWNNPQTPEPQIDCPRFTERRDWAENWNRSGAPSSGYMLPTGAEEEVVTTFTPAQPGTATVPGQTPQPATVVQVTNPDLTFTKIYFLGTSGTDSGWKVGLPYLVESYDVGGSIPQRQAVTNWTQDDDTSLFVTNPRVLETNVHDPAGNRKRTEIVYQQYVLGNGMICQLPEDIREYDANASSVLRTTRTIYEENAVYLNRRIIGLPKQRSVYGGLAPSGTLQSKVEFIYDQTAIEGTTDPAAIQHDNANFGVSFLLGRGNLTSVRRYDMNAPTQFTNTTNKYNRVGLLVAAKDADDHEVTVSYADSFASNGAPNESNPQDAARPFTTLAYPTTVNDADGYSTKFRYNYDFGARTWQQTPQPNLTTNTLGPIQTFTFDVIGRLARTTSLTNNAFTRYNYGLNYLETFSSVNTVVETANEGHTLQVFDGHGRVIATASDYPNTTPSRPAPVGGFTAQLVLYDRLGRVRKRSNPTETSISISGTINPSQFSPLGDDAIAHGGFGWKSVQQTYDWKGRPLVTTNQDGTTKAAAYTGCGCAGGEVVTLTDEGTIDAGVAKRRQRKIYADVLGRVWKTEILNWDGPGPNGTGGSVYSTTINTYNTRDQVTQMREYAGPEGSGTYQDTTMTYDGYGRLKNRHVPEQNPGANTVWDYNSDDTIQKITDARGASQTFSYNKRHLPTGVQYAAPDGSGITVPAVVSFGYDGAGNRVSMTDGSGGTTYGYDQLSRLTSEARTFTGLTGSFAIAYGYNLANQLTSLAEPTQFGSTFSYVYDAGGRLTNVNGSAFAGVTNYASNAQYRPSGGLKHLNYGNSKAVDVTYNSRLQAVTFDTPGVITKSYDYYADGAVRFSSDSMNHKWDRFYSYDHVGRIKEAFSGAEARFEGQTTNRPYRQTFSYDGFNHITDQLSLNWSTNYSTSKTYSNNRRNSWNYDAQGNLLASTDTIYSYDAAGRISTVLTSDPDSTTARSLDGDGQQVKTEHVSFGEQSSVTTICYYLRSSVLQGQVLTEIGSTGAKKRTFVYAGNSVLAWQVFHGANPGVVWQHQDPSQASFRTSDVVGQTVGHSPEEDPAELDPAGANAGLTAPLIEPVPPAEGNGSLVPYPAFSDPARPDVRYKVDGIPVSVDYFRTQVDLAFQSSLALAEAAARASAPRFQGYSVSVFDGRLDRNFGLSLNRAINEAIEQGNFTIIRNWLVSDNWFPSMSLLSPQASTPNPQKTGPLTSDQIEAISKEIGLLLTDKCATFINQIVTGITGKSYDSKEQLLEDFNKVRNGKGFTWGGKHGGSQGGNLAAGTADIQINSMYFFTDKKYVEGAASVTLHELIHAITGVGDKPLSNLVKELGLEVMSYPGHIATFPTDPKDDLAHSGYWGQALKNKCSRRGY